MRTKILLILLTSLPLNAGASLKVITSLPDLRELVREVGGTRVEVDSIAKGTQDPHYLEAKPSFMVKISRADLVVSVGLDLESAWLEPILEGARNPKVLRGRPGNLEVGASLEPLDVPNSKVTRADGDVHPKGNPHVTLDPIRMASAALVIAKRLSELDPEGKGLYESQAAAVKKKLEEKTKLWAERLKKSGVKSLVTYHKTLTYFLDRFQIEHAGMLEPKPGIPPSAGHLMKIFEMMRTKGITVVLIENYFDDSISKKIKENVPGAQVRTVPVLVDGEEGVKNSIDLFERIVSNIENKK